MHYCLIEEKLGETKIIKEKDVHAFSVQRTRLYRSLEQAMDHAGRKRLTRKRSRKKMETFWFFRLRFRRAYDTAYNSNVDVH